MSAPLHTHVLNTMKSLLLTSSLLLSMTACAMEKKEFDTEKWIAESKKDPEENLRWTMTEDVIRFVKPGMKRTDVIELLGQPGSSKDRDLQRTDSYFLGVPKLSIDTASYELIYVDDILEHIRYVQG